MATPGTGKLVEIDESELLSLRGVNEVVGQMLANPQSRQLVLRARKIQDPRAPIQEIDAAQPAIAAAQAVHNELTAWRKEQAERDQKREAEEVNRKFAENWERQKDALRSQGWRSDGIAEIEKFALERGVADLELAAAGYEKLHPPAEPVASNGYGSWDFFTPSEGDQKGFIEKMMESRGEDEGALRAETHKALTEFRSQQQQLRR
jgi:hypothetical protein